jgi:uncharacterized protein
MTGDRYLPGVPCWVDVASPDSRVSTAFYGGLFGWEFDGLIARLDGRAVAGIGPPGAASWRTHVRAGEGTEERIDAAGGRALPERLIADDAGAAFGLADSPIGAELVNAPCSWNWSNLHTPDPARAAAFYGAVFGWATADAFGSLMARLPAYGDLLEERDPGIRRRHAEYGAPEGFTDAVAWIIAADGEPRWDVTFAVADADAAASRAQELGGEVVVAPHDAGAARIAALRDPQGARFTVSAFVG